MKYVLILYLCSFAGEPKCLHEQITPIEYKSYYQCASDGYVRSYKALMDLGEEEVNTEKYAIKFECKEINTI
tara:strand:+ start:318 stop:533 length:216 start_codon:yes stop_codon:yes gene_type:complete